MPQTLIFYAYFIASQQLRPLMFQIINSVCSNSLRFTSSGCKEKEIRKFEIAAKTRFFLELTPPQKKMNYRYLFATYCMRSPLPNLKGRSGGRSWISELIRADISLYTWTQTLMSPVLDYGFENIVNKTRRYYNWPSMKKGKCPI